MARYLGSVCVLCRREGEKLFLKGERCNTGKCAFERRSYAPGPHGPTGGFRRKASDYATQLREKQKARRIYGIMERQFRRYFHEASSSNEVTGTVLLQYLERRFDNVIFRLGIASSRQQARQLILHGHFLVNGDPINVPSFLFSAGDKLTVTENSRKNPYFQALTKELVHRPTPEWLTIDKNSFAASMVSVPSRQQIATPLKEQLIVEYYSR